MSEPTDELNLLSEYNQWVAVHKLPQQDVSPEEFMRDRLKQVAFDRVTQAIDFIKSSGDEVVNHYVVQSVIDILEGTYVEPEETVEDVRPEYVRLEEAEASGHYNTDSTTGYLPDLESFSEPTA